MKAKITKAQVVLTSTAVAATVAAVVGYRNRKALAAALQRWTGMLSAGSQAAQQVIEVSPEEEEDEFEEDESEELINTAGTQTGRLNSSKPNFTVPPKA